MGDSGISDHVFQADALDGHGVSLYFTDENKSRFGLARRQNFLDYMSDEQVFVNHYWWFKL